MKTSLKAGFAQIFSCCPKNLSCALIWGGCSPPRLPGPYAYDFDKYNAKFTVTFLLISYKEDRFPVRSIGN